MHCFRANTWYRTNNLRAGWVFVSSSWRCWSCVLCLQPSCGQQIFPKQRTLAPSVSLLIGQLMSGNLLYLKSLLNAIVYARRLTKYRQAFYKSFRRKKNGKYSKEITRDGHATRRKYEVAELSSFSSTAVSKRSKNTELKIPIQAGLFLLPATRWWRAGVEGEVGGLINMPVKKKPL